MPQKLLMMPRNIIILIGVLSVILSCTAETTDVAYTNEPEIDTNLKEIIELDWDLTILEISKILPGGNLLRGDIKRKSAATYLIKLFLTDLDVVAKVSFSQDEEYIQGLTSKSNFSLRKIKIPYTSTEDREKRFSQICKDIKNNYPKAFTTIGLPKGEASYSINDFDKGTAILIDISDDTFHKKTLTIIIQKTTSRSINSLS